MSQFFSETPDAEQVEEAHYFKGNFAGGEPNNSTSNALENVRTVLSGQGRLYGFSGYSNKASAQFIQVHNSNAPPTAGAIPAFVIIVGATSNFGVWWGDVGRWFDRGVQIVNSSTAATYTAGAADTWFDAQYL